MMPGDDLRNGSPRPETNAQNDLAAYMGTQAQFDNAVSRLNTALGRGQKAEEFAKLGENADAYGEWRKIFGDYFPAYG